MTRTRYFNLMERYRQLVTEKQENSNYFERNDELKEVKNQIVQQIEMMQKELEISYKIRKEYEGNRPGSYELERIDKKIKKLDKLENKIGYKESVIEEADYIDTYVSQFEVSHLDPIMVFSFMCVLAIFAWNFIFKG